MMTAILEAGMADLRNIYSADDAREACFAAYVGGDR